MYRFRGTAIPVVCYTVLTLAHTFHIGADTNTIRQTIIFRAHTHSGCTRTTVCVASSITNLRPCTNIFFFRVHSHAAAALINFCEGVERDTLIPYLDPIVERLLKLLNPTGDNAQQVKRYVQEQAITTLAMVADASEATFAKVRYLRCLDWSLRV